MNTEANLWGIRAGQAGDADTLFLRKNRIALGWDPVGDLSLLAANREAFKAAIAQAFPACDPGRISSHAGQLFCFVHEMQVGDLVTYPSKRDRRVHFGRISGVYVYDNKSEPNYPHTRTVQWIRNVPRTFYSQGALHEIGSALNLFAIRNYADEFRVALEDKAKTTTPVASDESIAVVAANVEESTRDFVLKQLAQCMKGPPLTAFVGHLLNSMGYRAWVSPAGSDGGVDLIAHRDELGVEPPTIKVQVKGTEGTVADSEVATLYGKVGPGEHGLFVALGSFGTKATALARSRNNLRLIDGDDLVRLILSHYDNLDIRYKALIPLQRIFVPTKADEG